MIINNKVLELGIDWLFNAAITDSNNRSHHRELKGKHNKKKRRALFT